VHWPWSRVLPVALALIVVIAAAVTYTREIPIHHVTRARLAQLVVTTPPADYTTKGAKAAEVAASSNPFAAFAAAAKKSPNTTGAYSVSWTGSSASSTISVLASMLPSVADAKTAQSQAVAQYQPTSFKAQGFSFDRTFTVPSPAGASGITYGNTKGKSSQYAAVIIFRTGRTVIVEYALGPSATPAVTAATQLAGSEYHHLTTIGSAVSLKTTQWPLVASLVWWGVTAGLVLLILGVPVAVRRAERRRQERREREARRAFSGRGSKIAKRQSARRG
jgi:hypothetical protein